MAETIEELRSLSDEELFRRYNRLSKHTQVGTKHYLEEFRHRGVERTNRTMTRLTWALLALTVVTAVDAGIQILNYLGLTASA